MKFLIERLQKVFQLRPGERAILAQAWGLLLLVEVALRALSFKRLLALCQVPPVRRRSRPTPGAPSLERLVWLVDVAGRYAPVKATCLKKAFVLSWLLGRRGIPTALRIGVSRQEGGLEAHAWLDYDGRPILGDDEIGRYEPLHHA